MEERKTISIPLFFWRPKGRDETFSTSRQSRLSFPKETWPMLCSISKVAGQNLPSSPREATVTMLAAGDFFGEESMAPVGELRTSSAMAVYVCVALKIERSRMLLVLHEEHAFSDFFMQFILTRGSRTQADLVDQLFNSSERRLARTLLLMAEFGKPGEPEPLLPPVTQETLAEMIGTTRSRVSFFMNRFRKLGYLEYNGRIRVHASLLNMVLHDDLPEENATRPKLLDPPPSPARTAKRAQLV